MRTTIAYWYLVMVNLLDYYLTSIFVTQDGFSVESNPFLRHLMEQQHAAYPILIAKAIPLALLGWMLWKLRRRYPKKYNSNLLFGVLAAVDVCFTAVVALSLYTLVVYR